MALNKAYNQYKENSIYTSTPEELTLMLYNGLIKFIMKGQVAVDNKDMEKANKNIMRAQAIVQHFQTTLDKKQEISRSLELLYDYMYRRLLEANVKKDREMLDEVLVFAKELRDTWNEAMKIAKQQNRHRETVNV